MHAYELQQVSVVLQRGAPESLCRKLSNGVTPQASLLAAARLLANRTNAAAVHHAATAVVLFQIQGVCVIC
jgi:hypothetical protein